MTGTLYEVLGVAVTADADTIRRAYLGLARRHHPDLAASAGPAAQADAERRMRAINEAWSVLGDAGRRQAYDVSAGLVPDPALGRPFTPFDTGPEGPDPREQPDVPYRRATPTAENRRRIATVVPVGLFATSVFVAIMAMLLAVPALFGLAAICFILASLGFLVIPLVELSRASNDEG